MAAVDEKVKQIIVIRISIPAFPLHSSEEKNGSG